MTDTLRGVPAAPGAALGRPWIYVAPTAGQDRVELEEASVTAARDLEALAERLRTADREDEAAILDSQAMMAADPEMLAAARRLMADGAGASAAIMAAGEKQAAMLAAIPDEILAARAADVRDVVERIARVTRGQELPRLTERSVAVAIDLPPSITAELDPALLTGIALEAGSPTAHAAILARALGIPAVVGVSGLVAATANAELLGIDGGTGEVVVDPDEEARSRVDRAIAARVDLAASDVLHSAPLASRDGHRVMLGANIGRPEEAAAAAEAGADGVGLFRTEFMFMGRRSAPSVDEQATAYATALEPFADRPVVIRMLDVGGDKQLPYLQVEREDNPFLGVRALRLAAGHRGLLVGQLRAIGEAASRSRAEAWVMAPMVADLVDIELVRELAAEAGLPPSRTRLGIMVEVPSAAVMADALAGAVDFFSIGTNDLTQYLLAMDRTNPAFAGRQDPMHPAVLRAVRSTIEGGHGRGIPVAVCGEMASDWIGAVTLLGLGIDELSMDPRSFGLVKRTLAGVTLERAAALAAAACGATSAAEARQIVAAGLR